MLLVVGLFSIYLWLVLVPLLSVLFCCSPPPPFFFLFSFNFLSFPLNNVHIVELGADVRDWALRPEGRCMEIF